MNPMTTGQRAETPQGGDLPARRLLAIMRAIDFNPALFLIPAGLAFLAAASESACALLLIPTLKLLLNPAAEIPGGLHSVLTFFAPRGAQSPLLLVGALCTLTVTFAILKIGFLYSSLASSVSLTYEFTRKLQTSLFTLVSRLENRFFHENRQSDLAYFLHSFPDRLAGQMRPLHRTICNLLLLVAYSLLLVWISWKLSIVCFLLFFFYQRVIAFALKSLSRRAENAEAIRSDIGQQVTRLMSCYNLMKLLGETDAEAERFSKLSSTYSKESSHLGKWQELINPLFDMLSIIMAVVILYFSQRLWGGVGEAFLPRFLVYIFVLRRANSCAISARELQAGWLSVCASLRDIAQLFEIAPRYVLSSGDREFDGTFEAFTVEHLSFAYNPARPLLKDVSLTVPRGRRVAIIGPSGSGKSTLGQLFVRLWSPDSGRISFDGVPIEDFRVDSLRRHIAVVCQDTSEVFSGSIRDNLLYGSRKPVPEKCIEEMLADFRLLDRVRALPDMLDTLVTDKGVNLSGGERQLLSLMRALLRGSSMYILDEVTSSLDPETAETVSQALGRYAEGATIIEITHRLSRAASADDIYFLADGELKRVESRAELENEKGRYWKLLAGNPALERSG